MQQLSLVYFGVIGFESQFRTLQKQLGPLSIDSRVAAQYRGGRVEGKGTRSQKRTFRVRFLKRQSCRRYDDDDDHEKASSFQLGGVVSGFSLVRSVGPAATRN